jgi:hypothetical protein
VALGIGSNQRFGALRLLRSAAKFLLGAHDPRFLLALSEACWQSLNGGMIAVNAGE